MSVVDRFRPDPDGEAMADVATRWLADGYSPVAGGFDSGQWRGMVEAGWTALRLPEDAAGLEMPLRACLPLAEAIGEAGVSEPITDSAIVASALVARVGAPEDLLAGLADGSRIAVFCFREGNGTAPLTGVPGGEEVTDLIVGMTGGRGLFHARTEGTPTLDYPSIDGRRLSDRPMPSERLTLLSGEAADTAIALAQAELQACRAAEGLGALSRALGLTARYLSERRQFGRPLAEFQVLSHRVADMQVDLELARSCAAMLVPTDVPPPQYIADRATAQITRALRVTGERAIQLHGGMGMTEEMEIGRVFKRLLHLSTALGGETGPRNRILSSLSSHIASEGRP